MKNKLLDKTLFRLYNLGTHTETCVGENKIKGGILWA